MACTHYDKEIRKRLSFISMARPTVHTNPSRKWNFSKTLMKPEEFEITGLLFQCWRRKTFWKRGLTKTMKSRNNIWFPCPSLFSNRNQLKSKMGGDCWVFEFLWWGGKHLMHGFQSENTGRGPYVVISHSIGISSFCRQCHAVLWNRSVVDLWTLSLHLDQYDAYRHVMYTFLAAQYPQLKWFTLVIYTA